MTVVRTIAFFRRPSNAAPSGACSASGTSSANKARIAGDGEEQEQKQHAHERDRLAFASCQKAGEEHDESDREQRQRRDRGGCRTELPLPTLKRGGEPLREHVAPTEHRQQHTEPPEKPPRRRCVRRRDRDRVARLGVRLNHDVRRRVGNIRPGTPGPLEALPSHSPSKHSAVFGNRRPTSKRDYNVEGRICQPYKRSATAAFLGRSLRPSSTSRLVTLGFRHIGPRLTCIPPPASQTIQRRVRQRRPIRRAFPARRSRPS